MEENEVEKSDQPQPQENSLPEPIETPKDPETEAFENDPRFKWYVVHVNSGHERKVAISLMERVENSQMKDKIVKVLVPTQNKIVVESGRKKTVQERLFPGYVLVKMDLSDISWHLVRNTTGVTGFVGTGGKQRLYRTRSNHHPEIFGNGSPEVRSEIPRGRFRQDS